MITAIVQYKLPPSIGLADCAAHFDGIRERYGMDSQIKCFETACVTDNSVEAVLLPEAAE